MTERDRALRAFLSSASGALAPYRGAAVEVCHRLGVTPVRMEEFRPERPPPVEACRREVDSCDVFVLLLAHRYGVRPAGEERSYTELEYEWAASRPGRPVLAFVVDPTFAWPPPDIDRGADAEALGRFAARVMSRRVVRRFAGLAAFPEDLILALRPHETAATPREGGKPSGGGAPAPVAAGVSGGAPLRRQRCSPGGSPTSLCLTTGAGRRIR